MGMISASTTQSEQKVLVVVDGPTQLEQVVPWCATRSPEENLFGKGIYLWYYLPGVTRGVATKCRKDGSGWLESNFAVSCGKSGAWWRVGPWLDLGGVSTYEHSLWVHDELVIENIFWPRESDIRGVLTTECPPDPLSKSMAAEEICVKKRAVGFEGFFLGTAKTVAEKKAIDQRAARLKLQEQCQWWGLTIFQTCLSVS